jgi:hypothetical protein
VATPGLTVVSTEKVRRTPTLTPLYGGKKNSHFTVSCYVCPGIALVNQTSKATSSPISEKQQNATKNE